MAAFDDLAKKATDFIRSDKARKLIDSDKGEQVSDRVLDGVAGLADKATGGKHQDKIAKARKAADDKIGRNDGPGTPDKPSTPDIGPDGTRRP